MTKQAWMLNTVKDKSIVVSFDGQAKDHEWVLANRDFIQEGAYDDIRERGFLPILDLQPDIKFSFNEEKQIFDYKVEIMAYPSTKELVAQYFGILLADGVMISRDFKFVTLCDAL